MSESAPAAAAERIRKALDGGYPLIHIRGYDEARIESLLSDLAAARYGSREALSVWSVTGGLAGDAALADPLAVIRHVLAQRGEGFVLLKDFSLLLAGRPELVRGLRDLIRRCSAAIPSCFCRAASTVCPAPWRTKYFWSSRGRRRRTNCWPK